MLDPVQPLEYVTGLLQWAKKVTNEFKSHKTKFFVPVNIAAAFLFNTANQDHQLFMELVVLRRPPPSLL